MAKENIKKFYEDLAKNEELQKKLTQAQESYIGEPSDRKAAAEAILIPVAKEAGYDFTVEEICRFEREKAVERGISEEELENVSGGTLKRFAWDGSGSFPISGTDGTAMAIPVTQCTLYGAIGGMPVPNQGNDQPTLCVNYGFGLL